MSWLKSYRDGSSSFKWAAFAVGTGLLSLSVSGCGFHPLYGTTAHGSNLTQVMKSIQVATIPSRVGQRLRNELVFETTGGGEPVAPVYRLDIAIRESLRNTLVTQAGQPTGQVYELNAEFRLVRIKDNETIFKGASTEDASFDLAGVTGNAGSIYGDVRARIDAENRAARSLADTLKTRIAAFLSRDA